jgi:hypothetical protein
MQNQFGFSRWLAWNQVDTQALKPVLLRSGEPFNNSDVALGGTFQHAAGCLVRGALKRGRCFLDALELNYHGPHILSRFISLRGQPSAQEAPAAALDGGTSQLRILNNRVWIRDRSVKTNPISFGHEALLVEIVDRIAID